MAQFNQKFAQLQTFYLAGGGASIGDTSITLQSMTDIDGNALSMSGTFGTKGFGTLEAGNGNLEEQTSFTGLTNNTNGTVTLTGVSNVLFLFPYTETSGLLKTHAGSATFIISNTSGFYNELTSTADDEVITGLWQFPNNANTPILGTTYAAPTSDLQVSSKKYVDSVAIAGAPNASETTNGIDQLATKAQAAAGTSTGSTGARLVIPASMASATGGSGTTTAVISKTNGTIDSAFIDQTANYSWSGNTTLSGVVNITGTTFISGLSTVSNVMAFSTLPISSITPTTSAQLVTKTYVDGNPITYKNGATTYDLTTASGTQTIAHGLGRIPKYVKLTSFTSQGAIYAPISFGAYNGTTNSVIYKRSTNAGATTGDANSDTTNCIHIEPDSGGSGDKQVATATLDATNITLAWTKTASPTGTAQIMWEVV